MNRSWSYFKYNICSCFSKHLIVQRLKSLRNLRGQHFCCYFCFPSNTKKDLNLDQKKIWTRKRSEFEDPHEKKYFTHRVLQHGLRYYAFCWAWNKTEHSVSVKFLLLQNLPRLMVRIKHFVIELPAINVFLSEKIFFLSSELISVKYSNIWRNWKIYLIMLILQNLHETLYTVTDELYTVIIQLLQFTLPFLQLILF